MILEEQSLTILSSGDARSGKLWSGTPKNLVEALEAANVSVQCLDAGRILPALKESSGAAGKSRVELLWAALKGLPIRLRRSRQLVRYLNQNFVPGPLLHISPGPYLPLKGLSRGWRQYQVLDSTGNTWGRYTHYQSSGLQRALSTYAQRRSFRTMEHLFPISHFVREDLISHYGLLPEKVTAIGTGLGVIRPYGGHKDYASRLILTAAKERFNEKGANLLLAAFRLARKQLPHLRLVIVGKHELKDEIGDEESVQVTGFLPIEELQKLFEEASLFAMPATNEPWGLVYLEALSTKTPILGLDRCAFPELSDYGKAGVAVTKPTAEGVAEGILSLLRDPDKMRLMGIHGKQHVEGNYGWDKAAKRIIKGIYTGNQL